MTDSYQPNLYDDNIFSGEDTNLLRDVTKEPDKAKRFSLVNSNPILIKITIAKALSHCYWKNTYTIMNVYRDTGLDHCKCIQFATQKIFLYNKFTTRQLLLGLQLIFQGNLPLEMVSGLNHQPRKVIFQPLNVALDPK